MTVNVADLWPSGTVIELGTIPLDKLLDSVTDRPPGPAGPLIVRVPVAVAPPYTLVGFSVRLFMVGGKIVKFAVLAVAPEPAVIVAEYWALTPVVVTVNVAVVAPAGTETEAGTVALPELDDMGTVAPAGGAGDAKVTVPVDEVPP